MCNGGNCEFCSIFQCQFNRTDHSRFNCADSPEPGILFRLKRFILNFKKRLGFVGGNNE